MPGKDGSTVSGGGSVPLLRSKRPKRVKQEPSEDPPCGRSATGSSIHAKALSLVGASAASARGVADVRRVAFWVIKTRFPAALP